jgi:hypothetical protein
LQIYGKENKFDAARLIDLLGAYETFAAASRSARGSMDEEAGFVAAAAPLPEERFAAARHAAAPSSSSSHGEFPPLPGVWQPVSSHLLHLLSAAGCMSCQLKMWFVVQDAGHALS